MNKKIFCLLLILPIIIVLSVFTTSVVVSIPNQLVAQKIILEHKQIELFEIARNQETTYKLYGYAIPSTSSNSKIFYEVDDESIAYIKNDLLVSRGIEGSVVVNCYTIDRSLKASFRVEMYYNEGTTPRKIIAFDESVNLENSITNEFCYGQYDLKKGELVEAKTSLYIATIPKSAKNNYHINVKEGVATVKNNQITFKSSGKISIDIISDFSSSIMTSIDFNVIEKGVNVYSYDDLMACTNRSINGEIVVLRTNLESDENSFGSDGFELPLTKTFGYKNSNRYDFEVDQVLATYDTTYLDHAKLDKKLNVGINLKKDLYGNGFTINLHNLCFAKSPSNKNVPSLYFKGPKPFVNIGGIVEISGEDNIGLLINNDNITVDNLNIRNCNFVDNLSLLDYVGTVVSVRGDNVKITNSILSNGLTVLRSFSNENLLIENCILQYAREFIFKIGSDQVIRPPLGSSNLNNLSIEEKYNFLSPLPIDNKGNLLSDSSATVKNCIFYKSGFFSIGIDTHFSGEVLYGNSDFSIPKEIIYDLAGTSYASKLTVAGDTRFYDWKSIDEIDSSTLIKVGNDYSDKVSKLFSISQIIVDKAYTTPMYKEFNNKGYVHGGIAIFGGGRNESTITFSDDFANNFYLLDNITIQEINTLVASASGYGPFRFYCYKNTGPNYFVENSENVNVVPTIQDIKK